MASGLFRRLVASAVLLASPALPALDGATRCNARLDLPHSAMVARPATPIDSAVLGQSGRGSGARLRCRLIDGQPVDEWRRITLHDIRRVQMLNGTTLIKAWEHDREHGAVRSGLIQLPDAADWRASGTAGEQVHHLLVRRANAAPCPLSSVRGRCSSRVDLATRARVTPAGLELSQETYLNGRLAEAVSWRLPR